MGKSVPCYGCLKRKIGCHAKCNDYINWKKKRDEITRHRRLLDQLCNPEAKLHYSHSGWYQ